MDKELYIGVDASKKTLDLAYYDGETIDWKNAHVKVSKFSDFLYYHPFGSLITFGLAGRPAFFSRDFLDL